MKCSLHFHSRKVIIKLIADRMNLLTRLLTFMLGLTSFCHFGIVNSAAVANGTFNHPNFIVYFTVSPLPSKGLIINDVEDYFPMIEKLSSEFSQICCVSKSIIALIAVATYNKFLSTQHATSVYQKPLEVYLQRSRTGSATKSFENFLALADKSNDIYPGTIKYLIAHHSCFSKNSDFNQRWSLSETRQRFMDNSTHHTYKLGIALPLENCEKAILKFNSTLSDIVQLVEFYSNTINRYPSNRTVEESFSELTKQFMLCAEMAKSINPRVELVFETGISDNDLNKKQRDSSTLVTFWEMMNTWAIATNVKVIINEAFDTPDRKDYRGTRGLWKLARTPRRYHVPADFIFVDKRLGDSFNISEIAYLAETNLEIRKDFDFKHDNFVVTFDSNLISKHNNEHYYNHDDFLPLIRTIADKFSSLCLLEQNPVVTEAVAIHNSMAMQNKNKSNSCRLGQPLRVYQVFNLSEENNLDNIVKSANSLYPDTVKLLFHHSDTEKLFSFVTSAGKDISNQTVEFAINLPLLDCLRRTSVRTRVSRLLSYLKLIIVTDSPKQEDYDVGVANTVIGLTTAFARCKERIGSMNQQQSLKFALFLSWYDTDSHSIQNLSNLVSFWGQVNNWAKVTNTTVFMQGAFDTVYNKRNITNGWWRLAFKSQYIYHSIAEYVYEDKTETRNKISNGIPYVANKISKNGNTALQEKWKVANTSFSRTNFIVQFSLIMRSQHIKHRFNEDQIHQLILKLFTRFSSIYIEGLYKADLLYNSMKHAALEVAKFSRERAAHSLYLGFIMHKKYDAFQVALEIAKEANTISEESVKYLIAFIDSSYLNDRQSQLNYIIKAKNLLRNASSRVPYKLGCTYSIVDCGHGMNLKKELIPIIKVLDLIIFNMHPEDMDYEVGVYESFRGFTKQFERCKEKISKLNLSIEVAFRTSWSDMTKYHGHGLENLVLFWEKMNDWAMSTNTKVFMIEAFDRHNEETLSDTVADSKLGWWRLLSEENHSGSSKYIFEEKREVVLGNLAKTNLVEGTNHPKTVLVSVLTALIFSALTAFFVFLFVYQRYKNKLAEAQQYILTKNEEEEFLKGALVLQSSQSPDVKIDEELDVAAHLRKYDKDYEVQRANFNFDETIPLGSGEFGIVCKGTVTIDEQEIDVAVKTLKKSCSSEAVKNLLAEIKVMIHLGKHENIVSVIGAHTEGLRRGKVLLFTELCEKGSLENYLKALRQHNAQLITTENKMYVNEFINQRRNDELYQTDLYRSTESLSNLNSHKESEPWANGPNNITVDQNLLSRWSYEIANGMEFIVSKKVVHADLATRNVLLTCNLTAKISDFGLSRRLYNYTNYVKSKSQPLPWKWMSPESLRRSEFNEKTDVWAFGVTLWEIYSLGDPPYPGLSWTVTFPSQLEQGLRPQEPEFNANSMYSVMLRCWNIDPKRRPPFLELKEILKI